MSLYDAASTYRVMVFILIAGQLVATLEYLARIDAFRTAGTLDWKVLEASHPVQAKWPALGRALFSARSVQTGLLLRLVLLAALCLLRPTSTGWTLASTLLAANYLVFSARHPYGRDGSDQMALLIFVTCALAAGSWGSDYTMSLGLTFIAVQLILSYVVAGLAKLVSPIWRQGGAVYAISSSGTYGVPALASSLESHPVAGLVLSWNVIVFETGFAGLVFMPLAALVVWLAWGMSFHVATATLMGLNSFVWSFVACYPALVYVWLSMPWR